MNVIKSGLKSWKTTLLGIALAVVLILQETEDLTNWKEWLFPALVAALGILSRDANKSSKHSGIAPLLVLCFISMAFVSCTATSYIADLRDYEKQIEANPQAVELSPEHVKPVGGVEFASGVELLTDYGNVKIDKDKNGVKTALEIDLQSAK